MNDESFVMKHWFVMLSIVGLIVAGAEARFSIFSNQKIALENKETLSTYRDLELNQEALEQRTTALENVLNVDNVVSWQVEKTDQNWEIKILKQEIAELKRECRK